MDFQLTTGQRPGLTVITVVGELDIATAGELADVLEREHPAPPVVDLTDTTFLDSTGVRTLANGAHLHPELALICPASNTVVQRVLDLTGFDQVLTVHGSLDELEADRAGH